MSNWFFASDLHGSEERYAALFACVRDERPAVVLLGGDLLPYAFARRAVKRSTGASTGDFLADELGDELRRLRQDLGKEYPRILVILGNDDPRAYEETLQDLEADGLLQHIHMRRVVWLEDARRRTVYGCSWVPPTPFRLKDWERYDIGRGVDPGCVSPEQGAHSVAVDAHDLKYTTIAAELEKLAGEDDLSEAVFLFHAPPYQSKLDRAALDGQFVDHVPLDVHVGSVAIARFLSARQPRVALCGHIHESARLTGAWRDRLGVTHVFSAAHDGPELALVRFDPDRPELATRELIGPTLRHI